jgi:Spy/CpxP family protein refolding chaperone
MGLAVMWVGSATAQQSAPVQSMERTLQAGLPARWWKQPALAQKIGLSADQQKKMDDLFLQSRLKLIDLNASFEEAEALLEPLVRAERPDEVKVRNQIDRVAQARADLEKGNAYLLLGIRLILTPAQWKILQAGGAGPRPRRLGDENETPSAAGPLPAASKP